MRTSVLDSLTDFERGADGIAFVFPRGYRHERWTYRRVAGLAYQFARELEAREIRKGDAVLLWSPNCAEWVAAFLGCALCGVIAVPVDDASAPDFARRIGAQVRAKLVLCPRDRAPIFAHAFGDIASADITVVDPVDLPALVARHSSAPFRPADIQPPDTLEIVFTSGTTSEPKGVVLTHANVVGNLLPIETEIKKYLKYERIVHPIRFLNLLPLSHVFGQFLGIFLPPLLGGTVVFENTFNPTEVMNTIRRERVSVLVAVPRMLDSLKQKIERDLEAVPAEAEIRNPTDSGIFRARYAATERQHFLRRWWSFRAIRRNFGWKFWAIISGGAALGRDTEEFWHRLGYAVVQGYGLTETTSLVSLNHPFHTSRGSIGKVLPGRELKLAEDGEILVRGSGVADGYWKAEAAGGESDPAPVARPEDLGWYRTGDLGALDQEGNLFFKGRKKEVIVTPAGMNIYPEDLEAALRQQKEVRDCVVVGLERGGNAEPCAVLILRNKEADPSHPPSPESSSSPSKNSPATAAAIVSSANDSLAESQRMRSWFVWPEQDFPRSSTQKPRRNAIREAVEAALRGQATSAAASPLAELLTKITGRPTAHLTPETNLEIGLGLNSLERVELLGALEDRYQIDLSETGFANLLTVADLERLLRNGCSADKDDRASSLLPSKINPNEIASDLVAPIPIAPSMNASRSNPAADPRSRERPASLRSPAFHCPRWTLRWPVTWLRFAVHYLLARPAVFLLSWPRIIGRENLRGVRGPLLVVCNHISGVDVGLIQAALPARIRHKLATATGGEALELLRSPAPGRPLLLRLYDRVEWALGVALLNLFPLPRQSGFRKSFAYAGEAVDLGYSILVFPEGRHTEDGKLRPFRTGVGLLATNLRVPVLPMRIDGLFELKKAGKKFAAPGKIQVRIGTPMQFAPEASPEQIARALQAAVESLAAPAKL